MKKLLFVTTAICIAVFISAGLSKQTNEARALARQYNGQSEQLTNVVRELSALQSELREDIQGQGNLVNELRQVPSPDTSLLGFLSQCRTPNWAGAVPLKTRDALGLAWDNSPEYVLISKSALAGVYYFSGVDKKTGTLSPLLCDILGLTPEKQTAVESVFQRAKTANDEWLRTKIESVKPSGEILAEYRVPANPALTRSLEKDKEVLREKLGSLRSELMEKFSLSFFLSNGGFSEQKQRFTVRYTPARQPPLWYCVEYAGGSTSGDVTPTDFPEQYRSVFQGGWADVAQAGGFKLPEDFESEPSKEARTERSGAGPNTEGE